MRIVSDANSRSQLRADYGRPRALVRLSMRSSCALRIRTALPFAYLRFGDRPMPRRLPLRGAAVSYFFCGVAHQLMSLRRSACA